MLKAAQLHHLPAATAAAVVVVTGEAFTPSRPKGLARCRRCHCKLFTSLQHYNACNNTCYKGLSQMLLQALCSS